MTHMVPTVEQVNCNCQKTELPPSSDGQNQAHRLYTQQNKQDRGADSLQLHETGWGFNTERYD